LLNHTDNPQSIVPSLTVAVRIVWFLKWVYGIPPGVLEGFQKEKYKEIMNVF